ncbi:MAG TPA: TldD/PmbA family protein [Armatimonadota bacterium]|nr:TldD/PmbA family protein [Armatimonadota bacterium]
MVPDITDIASIVTAEFARMIDAGCSFADARFYDENAVEFLRLYDGNVEGNSALFERGIGVRVLFEGAWGFAATADLSAIPACFDRALVNSQAATSLPGFRRSLGAAQPVNGSFQSPVERDPFDVPLKEKLAFLQQIDERLKAPHVAHHGVYAEFQRRKVFYWNTEGTVVNRQQLNTFAEMRVIAPDAEGRTQRRSYELCSDGNGTRGFEWLADTEQFTSHTERIKAELAALLAAERLAPGRRDVILLPGQGFLQVHETIGHALELDRILGYELSFAGGSHVRPDMIGTLRYGSDKLNCQAGATPNSPGTFGFDDEGTPQQDYPLIKNGILVNVLSSRGELAEANAAAGREVVNESGSAARACAFYRPPIDRMTNVSILSGHDGTLDDIIAATEDGIVLDVPTSWSIGSNREHFHFGCEIAWEVKHGKRTRILKNPTYHGHTLEFWNSLDMVGDARTWRLQQVANCGKGEPNQVMEVGHGVPVMRFHDVETGEKE